MVGQASSQDIDVGPIHVDTGNDYMDIAFVVILIAVLIIGYAAKRRIDRQP